LLYHKLLPDAARSLAAALRLSLDHGQLSVRTGNCRVALDKRGWQVCDRKGVPLMKPFRLRAQAEEFADLIGERFVIDVPVMWIKES
jgi:hypothetical protein